MRKSERAEIISKELKKLYPSPPIPLDHTNAYTLLVAVVLSAQSTDKKVNELTKSLFKVADDPEKMMRLGINGIYEYINPFQCNRDISIYVIAQTIPSLNMYFLIDSCLS